MNDKPCPPHLLHEHLQYHACAHPSKTALVTARGRFSYQELDHLSHQAANALWRLDIGQGDRVALFMDNCVEAVIAFFAILKRGAIAVPLPGLIKERKLLWLLKDCGARAVITQTRKFRVIQRAAENPSDLPPLIWVGPTEKTPPIPGCEGLSWESFMASGASVMDCEPFFHGHLRSPLPAIYRDLAAIIYTSGSTGEPKGVMAPHCAILAAAYSIIQYLEHGPKDVILSALPLSFSYGLYQLVVSVLSGSTLILEESFLYPVLIMERVKIEQATAFPLVPTMVSMLRQLEDPGRFHLASIRYVTSAASAMPPGHLQFLQQILPQAKIFLMYGQTECARVSFLPPHELNRRPTSVGTPIPNCQVRIVNANGEAADPGEAGELLVRGGNVMRGYWNAPTLTAKTFRRDKANGEIWLHTGDIFTMDEDGFLTFLMRRDDLIKTRGERVSPREIERVILALDLVREAVVVGLKDELLGQSIAAAVVVERGRANPERIIRAHCSRHLESFMVPRQVLVLDHLPYSAHGKVDGEQVRQLLESALPRSTL